MTISPINLQKVNLENLVNLDFKNFTNEGSPRSDEVSFNCRIEDELDSNNQKKFKNNLNKRQRCRSQGVRHGNSSSDNDSHSNPNNINQSSINLTEERGVSGIHRKQNSHHFFKEKNVQNAIPAGNAGNKKSVSNFNNAQEQHSFEIINFKDIFEHREPQQVLSSNSSMSQIKFSDLKKNERTLNLNPAFKPKTRNKRIPFSKKDKLS